MIRRSTWIILLVFFLLVALALYLQRNPISKSTEATATASGWQSSLFDFDGTMVKAVSIVDAMGGKLLVVRNAEGTWTLVEPAQEGDAAAIQTAVNQLVALTTLSNLEALTEPGLLGLTPPSYILNIDLEDGTRHVLEVGQPTPIGSGYYVRVDQTELRVVGKYILDAIIKLVGEPPLAPTPTPTLIPVLEETATPVEGEANTETADPDPTSTP